MQILGIEEGLKRLDRTSAAMLVRVIQQNERVRLEMTAALQVLRRAAAREAWSWQRGGERAAAETTMNLKPSWARTEDCDPAACAIGCACAKDGPEPTEEEAPLPEETDSSSWPLVGAGQDLDDDVTQEATAEMATLAMTPDQEARRAASVAGLGFDSRQARER